MKRNLFIMYAISFFQGMVFYSSIATLYRQAAGISVFQITVIESISFLLAIVFEIPWGIFADRIGYRRTMILCNAMYFLSKIIFWRARGFAGFLLERAILAVVVSGLSGVDTSVLYLSCREDDPQRVFGLYTAFGTAGLLVAAGSCTAFIGEQYRTAGFLTVITYGTAAMLTFGLKEVKAEQQREKRSIKHSLQILGETLYDRELFLLIAGIALFGEVNQTITVFLNQLQYTKAGISVRMISGIYILVTLSGLVSVFSAPLTKRVKPRLLGAALFLICGFSCLALALTADPFVSVFGVLSVRASFSLMSPLGTELQNKRIVTDDRATALSINTLLMDLLAVFTNLGFGRLADLDLSAAMCFGGFLCFVGMGLYLRSFHRS